MDTKELVEAMAAGDARAWRAFMDAYGRLVYAVASRFALRGVDRDDLFQETCLKAFQSLHTLQRPERLASWVYTIAYRLGVDALRRLRFEHNPGDIERIAGGESPGPLEGLERLEEVARLQDALGLLDERCRQLLAALYLEDQPRPYAEISREQRMPVGSIGPTRARCLEKLKKAFEELSKQPPDASA
jgi:RNA polymerase sigma factor (sigma-70 family)